ncbi:gliding motility-associated C-terminal domain-containing protein [Maribellus sediminis]|uniref:T9SS type B sorting domain-containing protein n=1 Tax=Maribellus sediminis TaxID=2696285 RepID=UPI00143190A6|nr:gliding motility-associated C-terminal domain-containing protein [Maribellus sediminis]
MIIALLAALFGAAQEAFVVYEGAEKSFFVEDHSGSEYSWSVLVDLNPDTEADTADYEFATNVNRNEVTVLWKTTGMYYLNVSETDVTGCTNRKVIVVNVMPNNRNISFTNLVSSDCYNVGDNSFILPIILLDETGLPLPGTDYPVLVEFQVNENSFEQQVAYDNQQINIDSNWFSVSPDQESTVPVRLKSAKDIKGINIPVSSGGSEHIRSIHALPVLQFDNPSTSEKEQDVGTYTVSMIRGNSENAVYSWFVDPPEGSSTDLSTITTPTADIYWDGPSGIYTVKAVVIDGNSCVSDTVRQTVEVEKIDPEPIQVNAGPDTIIGNCNPYFFDKVAPIDEKYTYLWEPAQYLSDPAIPNPVFTPGETTTYRLTVTTDLGYSYSDSVTITVSETEKPQIQFLYTDNDVDEYTKGQYEAGLLSGDIINTGYHWFVDPPHGTDSDMSVNTGPLAKISWLMIGKYTVGVYFTDENGCSSDTITQLVEVHKKGFSPIPLSAGPDTTISSCEPYTFTGVSPTSDNYTYSWEPAENLSDPTVPSPTFTAGATTSYVLTVSNSAGNSARDTVVVSVVEIAANAGEDLMIPEGSTILLDGSASEGQNITYQWTTENGNIDEGATTAFPIVSQAGTYYLEVSDKFGCTALDSVVVSRVIYAPIANNDYDTTDFQSTVAIDVLANDEFTGSEPDINTLEIVQYPLNGNASVNYANGTIDYTPGNNFVGSDLFEYRICNVDQLCDEAQVYVYISREDFLIPEAFTPNGDNINDFFEIKGIQYYPGNSITIINRWGKKVYEAKNYGINTNPLFWDGKSNVGGGNGDLPTGTYFYVIDLGNGDKKIGGSVYLDR